MKEKNKYFLVIGLILLAGIFLRFSQLGKADFVTDEALNSFRSVGLLDVLTTEFQTTPVEWLDQSAWWLKLSFHDHPILTFMIQKIFFGIFGVSGVVARIPFALAGLLSIYLLYVLIKKTTDERLALLAAAIFSVSSFAVWISRIGLQEAIVIFFMLLSLVLFVKALDRSSYWKWFGLVFGLGLLSKYTILYLIPVVFMVVILENRSILKTKNFWLSWIIALLVFSPVIIYNLQLYKNFGHFDLQFSYLLKQDTPNWQLLPGKSNVGPLGNFSNIWTTLASATSLWFLWGFAISFVYGIYSAFKKRTRLSEILVLNVFFLIVLFTFIGPGVRFLSMFTPFAAALIALLFFDLWQSKKRGFSIIAIVLVAAFVLAETAFSINSNILIFPKGKEGLSYTQVITQKTNWGYQELDKYLHDRLDLKVTTLLLASRRPLVGEVMKENLDKRLRDYRLEQEDTLVIYDININWYPRVWYLNRRALYNALPLVTADDFIKVETEEGSGYYRKSGFESFVFIKAENTFLSDSYLTEAASDLASLLDQNGVIPEQIFAPDGSLAFKVYEF